MELSITTKPIPKRLSRTRARAGRKGGKAQTERQITARKAMQDARKGSRTHFPGLSATEWSLAMSEGYRSLFPPIRGLVSMRELSRLLDVSVSTVFRWLNEIDWPEEEMGLRLLGALKAMSERRYEYNQPITMKDIEEADPETRELLE